MPSHARLRKEVTLIGVYAVATGATLSAGLFLLPGLAAQQAGPAIVLCYLLAVVPLVPAVFSMVELATAMPRAGGAYYFLDRSLGPLAGTVGGIGTWLALTLKTAFALVGMGAYLAILLPSIADSKLAMTGIAVGFAVLFGLINLWGAEKSGGAFQALLVLLLLSVLAWFGAAGAIEVDVTRFRGFFDAGAEPILAATGLVYIGYVGVTKVASISEEVKDPERSLPLGMFASLGTVLVVYAVCTVVMVGVIPMDELRGNLTPMAEAAQHIGGTRGVVAVSAGALAAFASVVNAGIFSASRYPLAMGRDHLLPRVFRTLDRRGAPTVGLAVTVGAIIALVVLLDPTGIAKLASTFQLLMFGLLCLAVIVMRESRIDSYDPGSPSPLYPWMQIFGMVMPLALIGVMGWMSIIFSCLLIAVGIAWYYAYARHHVVRHGAIYHVFERLGRRRFDPLDRELRGILKEKGLRAHDPFDHVMVCSGVLDFSEAVDYGEVVRCASTLLAERLPCDAETLERGFEEGTRTGVTPVSGGVALPHMRLSNLAAPEMVLVRAQQGVDVAVENIFGETHTAQSTHAFFFLVSPDDDPAQHLRLLANLASRVDDQDFIPRWLSATDPDGLRALFLRGDRHVIMVLDREAATAPLVDMEIRALGLPEGALVALLHRPGEPPLIPGGATVLREGDQRATIIGEAIAIDELRVRYDGR